MIGGHFDSWHAGTGATDDACGSAVCMEALRILKLRRAKGEVTEEKYKEIKTSLLFLS